MEYGLMTAAILFAVVFAAGIIDSIAGGGGLLTLPAYLALGLPPQTALGTNKAANSFGTAAAVWRYGRKGKISLKTAALGIGFSLLGAWTGTRVVLGISPAAASLSIALMMPLGILALVLPKKDRPESALEGPGFWAGVPLVCLSVGFYDGFFGPGAGSFLALGFYLIGKFSLLEATANAKVFNLASNVGALFTFFVAGRVEIGLGVLLAGASIAGNVVGSHLALKKGDRLIRSFFTLVMALLAGTLIWKTGSSWIIGT